MSVLLESMLLRVSIGLSCLSGIGRGYKESNLLRILFLRYWMSVLGE